MQTMSGPDHRRGKAGREPVRGTARPQVSTTGSRAGRLDANRAFLAADAIRATLTASRTDTLARARSLGRTTTDRSGGRNRSKTALPRLGTMRLLCPVYEARSASPRGGLISQGAVYG